MANMTTQEILQGIKDWAAPKVIYDISAAHNNTKYTDLSDALGTNGGNIPQEYRKGGITVRFVCTNDNKYIRYNLLAQSFTTDVEQWAIDNAGVYVDNPEFVEVHIDKYGKILWAIEKNGNIKFGAGVPQQVIDYIEEKIADLSLDEYEDIVAFLSDYLGSDTTLKRMIDGINASLEGKLDAEGLEPNALGMVHATENPNYMQVTTDTEGKILEGISAKGRKEINIPIDLPSIDIESIENEEWSKATIDEQGKIISGIKKDGSHYLYNLESESIDEVNKRVDDISADYSNVEKNVEKLLNWKDKTFWWCGTSIPAAGYWDVNREFTYPYMVGQNLRASRVYNESVGSSQAIRRINAESYEVVSRRMGNTIADALNICADLWTIDDVNKTVTAGPRTIGITMIPNVTTYLEACYQRYLLLSNGYEIKLISKYLISDPTQNEQFLREKFGDLYSVLTTLHPNAYNYQGDIDMFVIDHGHNDGPRPVGEEYVDSTDISTFIGAINTYIRLIMAYKPHARIVILSDYDNSRLTNETIEAQQQIAEHWHLPFLNLTKHLPFIINTKVKVRGYWNTSGTWVETGFTYNPDAQTVAEAFSENGDAYMNAYLGSTIHDIAQHITPEQDSNGVWWYYLEPRYIWIRDGLHPHTDASGRCLSLYAKIISEFINQN